MSIQTLQRLFNRVVRGLAKQGFRQSKVDGDCAYRGDEGRKCAAGQLLSNRNYRKGLEHKSLYHEGVRDALVKSGVPREAIDFVSELQSAHDWNTAKDSAIVGPDEMKINLAEIGLKHGLELPRVLTA